MGKWIYSTNTAFAAVNASGKVVSWGDALRGGDSSHVQHQLQADVIHICSTDTAFAALKSNGSVVTWGDERYGGNSTAVGGQLDADVEKVFSTDSAFAAVKSSGAVVTWGEAYHGGDCSLVQEKLALISTSVLTDIHRTGAKGELERALKGALDHH